MIVKKKEFSYNLPNAESVLLRKRELAHSLFEGQCYICQKPYGKGFAFHHKEYDPSRKTHRDFKNTIDYNKYVIPEVIEFSFRFRLYCKICHARIDQPRMGYLGHMKKDKLIRLFIGAFETIPKPRGNPVAPSGEKCLENKSPDEYVLREINNLKTFLVGYTE